MKIKLKKKDLAVVKAAMVLAINGDSSLIGDHTRDAVKKAEFVRVGQKYFGLDGEKKPKAKKPKAPKAKTNGAAVSA